VDHVRAELAAHDASLVAAVVPKARHPTRPVGPLPTRCCRTRGRGCRSAPAAAWVRLRRRHARRRARPRQPPGWALWRAAVACAHSRGGCSALDAHIVLRSPISRANAARQRRCSQPLTQPCLWRAASRRRAATAGAPRVAPAAAASAARPRALPNRAPVRMRTREEGVACRTRSAGMPLRWLAAPGPSPHQLALAAEHELEFLQRDAPQPERKVQWPQRGPVAGTATRGARVEQAEAT
jgi:hypothetical protein